MTNYLCSSLGWIDLLMRSTLVSCNLTALCSATDFQKTKQRIIKVREKMIAPNEATGQKKEGGNLAGMMSTSTMVQTLEV